MKDISDDGTKDPTRRDESRRDESRPDATRSDATRSDPTRSDPTRSDPMKGRVPPVPGEAPPAREVPAGQKSPLGEDTSARRTDPARPTAAPASAPATEPREGIGTSGMGSREGAGALDRETGDSANRDSANRDSANRESAARESAARESAAREGKGGATPTGAHARPTAQETRQLPDQDHDHDHDNDRNHDTRLLPQDECDKFELRMRHAVGGFVDGPRDSVAEADQVLEELAARFSDAVTRRRSTLRTSWQQKTGEKKTDEKTGNGADTEQLRIALRDYREVTERLLHF
ncbi:hypothetical protein ACIPC1_02500 [Streptomyces sp. NPDC087263]|uniref:hypothetical protein n=1 Tax=Streptomyces sp. NPDC087263 TaxID=3365773 RepID=UPI003820654B